jgi:hypothetical protein
MKVFQVSHWRWHLGLEWNNQTCGLGLSIHWGRSPGATLALGPLYLYTGQDFSA